MADFISVAKTSDLVPGEGKVVDVNGTEIAVFNVDGDIYAIDNICVHRGGPLGDGVCEGKVVSCPWHGWRYDVTNGACQNVPGQEVDTYEVRVDGTDVRIKV